MNTTKNTVAEQIKAMEKILCSNLKQSCKDIEEWETSGTLNSDSIVRIAAEQLTDDAFEFHALIHVQNSLNKLARQFVISSPVL